MEAAGDQLAIDGPHHRLDDLHYLAGDGGPFETIDVTGRWFVGAFARTDSDGEAILLVESRGAHDGTGQSIRIIVEPRSYVLTYAR